MKYFLFQNSNQEIQNKMNKRSITLVCPYGTQLFDNFDTSPYGGAEFRTHKIVCTLSNSNLFEDINVIVDKDINDIKISKKGKINVIKSNIIFSIKKIKLVRLYFEIRQLFFDTVIGLLKLLGINYKKYQYTHFLKFFKYFKKFTRIIGISIWFVKILFTWNKVFKKINKDILCLFGVSSYNYSLFLIAKKKFNKIILFSTSDSNFSDESLNLVKNLKLDEYNSYYRHHTLLLNKVENIIVQNEYQKDRIEKFLNNKKILQLFCPFKTNEKKDYEYDFIWIGKFDKVKNVEILFDSITNKELKINIFTNAISTNFNNFDVFNNRNIRLFKHASRSTIDNYLSKSKFLINTSHFEGFPNTFLDAFSFGIPVLSLNVDPNNIIKQHNLGYFFDGDIENFKNFINKPSKHSTDYNKMSVNCQKYLKTYHSEKEFMLKLEKFI